MTGESPELCPAGVVGAPGAPGVVFSERELQELPIDPGVLVMQPDRGTVLVNIETVAYTVAAEQRFDTEVLSTPVTVWVAPVEYRWEWGEGTSFTTTNPGARWPDHTVWHVYPHATAPEETRAITLTTVWAAEFSVAGGPVWPVSGQAVTALTTDPFTVITARTYLTDGSEIGRG